MLVTAEQLSVYGIDKDLWFARRTGFGEPISRDQYFIDNPNKLEAGLYCAIGDDESGWELEQYNGVNWVVCAPDESYRLVITSDGLKALTNIGIGGYLLQISGIKIIDQAVVNPSIPFINWTDEVFQAHGDVKFSIGTINAHNKVDENGDSHLKEILSWRYNSTSGGLQYILNLPPEGLGSLSDDEEDEWDVGCIGLYIKDTDGVNDILFAVASLTTPVRKYGKNVDKIGNRLKFYFNTVLSNLGFVSNLSVLEDGNQSLPEVANESLLIYPNDAERRPYNCYLVDDLYGSDTPALAVRKKNDDGNNWIFFQPSDNFVNIPAAYFDDDVLDYEFVYWDGTKYKKAQGRYFNDEPAENTMMPVGVRVGNSIIYSGEVVNTNTVYKYSVSLYNGGLGYRQGDILNIVGVDNIVFQIKVTSVTDPAGEIVQDGFELLGPYSGNVKIEGDKSYIVKGVQYDSTSPLPRTGVDARFKITASESPKYLWDFSTCLNEPLYCDKGSNAGKPTTTVTDCFLGWATGQNSIRLALDLRNEASETIFGTTRYASKIEVKDPVVYGKKAKSSAVTPLTLYENYLQKTLPSNSTQEGATWNNPIKVYTKVQFKETVVGKSVTDFSSLSSDNHWNNGNTSVDFWGKAYRAEWADLAEYYEADEIYQPGTLITFGAGEKEITKAQFEVEGVISSKPGLQLGKKINDHYLPVALTGRVPVMMDGNSINYFGDKIYLSRIKPGTASTIKNGRPIGKIIDKNPGTKRLLECVVRIDFNND